MDTATQTNNGSKTMIGTEKQILWASEIKQAALQTANDHIDTLRGEIIVKTERITARPQRADKYRETIKNLNRLIGLWETAICMVNECGIAAKFIDNRDGLFTRYYNGCDPDSSARSRVWSRMAKGNEL